ncbi:MAG: 50S ribosomal protein L13 [Terriglobia bacterium]
MSTYFPKASEISHQWYVVDAQDQVLGRLASHVANLLSGKLKPGWVPFMDTGDHVIVINAEKVKLTGKKINQKRYFQYSGYPGGMKATSAREMKTKRPDRMVEMAIKGMLPKNKLGRAMASKLKVYVGDAHPHQAQQPVVSVIHS